MTEYLNAINLIGKAQSGLLEMVKLELDIASAYDINNVQAMMLFNIGDAEMSIGELTLRGCYLGSNVSYNVRKMVDNGYVIYKRSPHDKRTVFVRVSEKGTAIVVLLNAMFNRQRDNMAQANIKVSDLAATVTLLTRLERMWSREHSNITMTPAPTNPAQPESKPLSNGQAGKPVVPEDGRKMLRFVP